MSIRTVFLGAAVPFALLACSASAAPEATGEQSGALVRPGPPPSLCGFDGWPACKTATPCEPGVLDVNGTCVACGKIHTTVSAFLEMDSSGFASAVVTWDTTPAVPVELSIQNTSANGQYVGSYSSYTPGDGVWTFHGLGASATYNVMAAPFEPGEVPCGGSASTTITTPPSSVTLDLGTSDNDIYGPNYSKGSLTIHQDGTWYVSGAYVQLGMVSLYEQWAKLTCYADPGVAWPTWVAGIGGNPISPGTANLLGSGQSSGLTSDWLKIVGQTSAHCQIETSTLPLQ